MRCALSIAGSDSIGGAGIQADVKAMASVGVHACTVITAVTAQNTTSVRDIFPMPTDFIQEQLEAVLKDVDVKAIKTGMLYSADIVETVADIIEDHDMPLVIDPVMVAGVGDSLATDDLAKAIRTELMPLCELITPNRHEAEILAKMKINSIDDAKLACELIGKEGSSVLLKGGHMDTKNVVDYLYLSSEITEIENPRLERAGHGGGCTLSAYITAHMAKSVDIVNSVIRSRALIQESIASMYAIGKGDKLVNPMVKMQDDTAKFHILDAVDAEADRIMKTVPVNWSSFQGINLAFATERPSGPEDIAGIDGRITVNNGRFVKNGKARFGAGEYLSYIILATMKHDPSQRAALSLVCSDDIIDVAEEVGLTRSDLDRKRYKNAGLGELVDRSIKADGICDILVDRGTGKKDASIRILGKDPADISKKLDLVL